MQVPGFHSKYEVETLHFKIASRKNETQRREGQYDVRGEKFKTEK